MSTDEQGVSPETERALDGVDREKLNALREKIAKYLTKPEGEEQPGEGGGPSAEEAPAQEQAAPVANGKDVDWSKYDLEFHLRHLYPQATVREVDGVPKWVVMIPEFFSTERDFRNHGKKTNDGEPLNLGEFLSDKLNSPEAWTPVSLLPTGMGRVGVLLSRQQPLVLPDPKPLKVTEETPAPTDAELQATEDAALKFMEGEGLTPPAPVEEDVVGTPEEIEGAQDAERGEEG